MELLSVMYFFYYFFKVSKGQTFVVAKCESFVYDLKIQSKKQSKLYDFLNLFKECLLACIKHCQSFFLNFIYLINYSKIVISYV